MLLKNGDSGLQVKYLQQGLRIMCCNPGNIDSVFGPGTQAAVQKFQEEQGLAADGMVRSQELQKIVHTMLSLSFRRIVS